MTALNTFFKCLCDGSTLILSKCAVQLLLGEFRAGYPFRSRFFDYGRHRDTACHGISDIILHSTLPRDLFLDW